MFILVIETLQIHRKRKSILRIMLSKNLAVDRLVTMINIKNAVIYLLIAFFVGFHLFTLKNIPQVWMDEPWYTENAWTFVKEGHFGNKMFSVLFGLEKSNIAHGRLYLLVEALSFKIFGKPGPFQARLPQFIFGLLSLYVLYRLIKHLFDKKTAVWTTLVFACSVSFLKHSHDARPEMMLAFFIILSLYLLILAEERSSGMLYFLSGLIATLSADIHLNGVIVPIALCIVILYRGGFTAFIKNEGILFLSGVFTGALWWYFLHVYPDPDLFIAQWNGFWKSKLPVSYLFSSPAKPFIAEINRYLYFAGIYKASLGTFLAFIISIVYLLFVGMKKSEKTLLALMVSIFILMAFVVSNKTAHYVILVFPFFIAFITLAALRQEDKFINQRLRIFFLYLFLIANILSQAVVFYRFWDADYDSFVSKIKEHIPEGARIQGQPTYWFGFYDHPFWADHYFAYKRPYGSEVKRLKIDYIIADEFFLEVMIDEKRFTREEIYSFLENECDLVAEVKDRFYGEGYGRKEYNITRIYRVRY